MELCRHPGRRASIISSLSEGVLSEKDGQLSFQMEGGFTLPVGTLLEIKSGNYCEYMKINEVLRDNDEIRIECCSLYNKAYWFLLPLLKGSYVDFDDKGLLLNVYINKEKSILEVLYTNLPDSDKTLKFLLAHDQYVHNYILHDKFRVFQFTIPDGSDYILELYSNGQYSKLPRFYKEHIVKFFDISQSDELLSVFEKDSQWKKMLEKRIGMALPEDVDIWSKPIEDKEALYEEHLKDYENAWMTLPSTSVEENLN